MWNENGRSFGRRSFRTPVVQGDINVGSSNEPHVKNPKITVVSDSICGRISITGVDFQVIGGFNISPIEGGDILKVGGYDIIILHEGTVELRQESGSQFRK